MLSTMYLICPYVQLIEIMFVQKSLEEIIIWRLPNLKWQTVPHFYNAVEEEISKYDDVQGMMDIIVNLT